MRAAPVNLTTQSKRLDCYLDALEGDKASVAALEGKKYSYILEPKFRWGSWAAPKGKDANIDHKAALTGDDCGTSSIGSCSRILPDSNSLQVVRTRSST
jgi:hypothetical protein